MIVSHSYLFKSNSLTYVFQCTFLVNSFNFIFQEFVINIDGKWLNESKCECCVYIIYTIYFGAHSRPPLLSKLSSFLPLLFCWFLASSTYRSYWSIPNYASFTSPHTSSPNPLPPPSFSFFFIFNHHHHHQHHHHHHHSALNRSIRL